MAASSCYNLTSSSSSLLLFLLLVVVVAPCSCLFLPDTSMVHDDRGPHPQVFFFDDPETFYDVHCRASSVPWIAVDERHVTETLANTQGFRIASAILQQQQLPLHSFILVDFVEQERNGTKLFIPYCDGINMYIRKLENEMEIIEKDPGIIVDLITGRRFVRRLEKRVVRFYGGRNVSMSHPFIYSSTFDDHEGFIVHGADGFGSLEFPVDDQKAEGDQNNKLKIMKIEMVVEASVVPDQSNCDKFRRLLKLSHMPSNYLSNVERHIMRCKRQHRPFGITMIFSLYISN